MPLAEASSSTPQIIAQLLGVHVHRRGRGDPLRCGGKFDAEKTHNAVGQRLRNVERAVVPGFYGSLPDGTVKTFSRGGSDVTGAIVARGVGASVYENWTDVTGLLMADPRIIDGPKTIDTITYRELRELAYMGATVLHDEAIFPVRAAGIPVNIRNTNLPDEPGTMIVSEAQPVSHMGTISGIAGRKDFTVIAVEKTLMNQELGFGRRLLNVLESHGVCFRTYAQRYRHDERCRGRFAARRQAGQGARRNPTGNATPTCSRRTPTWR